MKIGNLKNLQLIFNKVAVVGIVYFLGLITLSLVLGKLHWLPSILLGGLFSLLIVVTLVWSQSRVIEKQKTMAYFPGFIIRMLLYFFPLLIALKVKSTFNFYIVLVSLLSLQVIWVVLELTRHYIHLKKRP
ncbi:MAG: ATP synthase subunit I [Candidatus Margulisiibacteriota bacterium]